jgi:hypothetical protein
VIEGDGGGRDGEVAADCFAVSGNPGHG